MTTVGSTAWTALAFVHRWLGIAGCLLFLLWFVSGIAMIYVRMPELPERARWQRAPTLQLDTLRFPLNEARATARTTSPSVQISMLGARPVYRFAGARPVTVFADTGEPLLGLAIDDADALAGAFASGSETPRSLGTLQAADQWTLQLRPHFPLFHYGIADGSGSEFYISSATGEVVMQTTRRSRTLAYLGPVAHWLYLPVLRRNGALWTNAVVWSSSLGCVLCVTGLLAGFLRFAPFRPFSMRGHPARSPYAGWMKWHHYAGLLFGVITLTWTFSGLLSMDPFPALAGPGLTAEQREAVSGGSGPLPTPSQIRLALDAVRARVAAKELRLLWFRGEPYWIASGEDRGS